MRLSRRWAMALGCVVGFTLVSSFAQAQTGGSSPKDKYAELLGKSRGGARSSGARFRSIEVNATQVKVLESDPAQIVTVPLNGGSQARLGVKVWAKLVDGPNAGQYVNLVKYKWQRKERFRLVLEVAVPTQLSLFQNFPPGGPPSIIRSPDERYPESFATVPPGVAYEFPVTFEMDDNLEDELMSIVVVNALSGELPINVAPRAAASGGDGVSGPGGSIGGISGPGGTIRATLAAFTDMNQQAKTTGTVRGGTSRFQISGPPAQNPPICPTPDDVCFFLVGPGNVGQFEITLHKD